MPLGEGRYCTPPSAQPGAARQRPAFVETPDQSPLWRRVLVGTLVTRRYWHERGRWCWELPQYAGRGCRPAALMRQSESDRSVELGPCGVSPSADLATKEKLSPNRTRM